MSTTKKKTTEQFVNDAKKVHGDKYDYSKVEYVNGLTEVCIICPIHGEFWQKPKVHLKGCGCTECGKHKSKQKGTIKTRRCSSVSNSKSIYTLDDFLYIANEKYGDRYDYSKMEYVDYETKVCIICPEHGEFWQTPKNHTYGCGCKKCVIDKKKKIFSSNTEEFISKANKVFNNLFSYENVKYVNNLTKVSITCRKHGDFLCTPGNHLRGRGCPICKAENYVYEDRLYNCLLTVFDKDDIVRQYRADWLTNRKSIDFFIPKYNIGIEHQGSQHFKPVKRLGGEEKYLKRIRLDKEKHEECLNNNVKLLYFAYEKYTIPKNYLGTVYGDEKDLIIEIKKLIK